MATAYIVDAVRTAGGRRGGKLAGWHPVDLAGATLDTLVARTGIDAAKVAASLIRSVGPRSANHCACAALCALFCSKPEMYPSCIAARLFGSNCPAGIASMSFSGVRSSAETPTACARSSKPGGRPPEAGAGSALPYLAHGPAAAGAA